MKFIESYASQSKGSVARPGSPKPGLTIMFAGIIYLLIAAYVPGAGIAPLAGYNSTTITDLKVVCGSPNAAGQSVCDANFTTRNINATMGMHFWYAVAPVCSPTCQAIFETVVDAPNIPVGQVQVLSVSLGTLAPGNYNVFVKILSDSNQQLSYTQSVMFNTNNFVLTLTTVSTVTVALSPSVTGNSCNGGAATCYNYLPGTQVTATATVSGNGAGFSCWNLQGSVCSSANPIMVTMNYNQFLTPILGDNVLGYSGPYQVYFTKVIGATQSPAAGITNIYPPNTGNPTSLTYTVAPNQYYTLNSMMISGTTSQGQTITPAGITSSGGSMTVTYAALLATGYKPGTIIFYVGATITPPNSLTILDSSVYPGKATISPVPGTYPYKAGSNATITASNIANGYIPAGWVVDGTLQKGTNGNNLTLTVQMNGMHVIMPNILKQNAGCQSNGQAGGFTCTTVTSTTSGTTCTYYGGFTLGCKEPPPPPQQCTASGTNTAIQVTVFDSSTQKPISGASVSVSGVGGNIVQTDTNGNACVANLAVPGGNIINGYTGSISVTASAKGYATQVIQVPVKGGLVSTQLFSMNTGGIGIGGLNVGELFAGLIMAIGVVLAVKRV